MTDISDLVDKEFLDVREMASLMNLPKGDFIRLLGEREIIETTRYVSGRMVEYKYLLEMNNEQRNYRKISEITKYQYKK